MAEDRTAVREIVWSEVFPSVLLMSAWRAAIRIRVLVLAALGVLVTGFGWRWLEQAFHIKQEDSLSAILWNPAPSVPSAPADWLLQSPPIDAWRDLSKPFLAAFDPTSGAGRFWYLALCALWGLAIWSLAGGAICRISAVEFSREERLSLGQALSFARQKWLSLIAAPLYPMFGVILASIPLALLGFISRSGSFGVVILGLLWPLVLLAAAAMAVLLVGLFFNWPFMWPTIATEGTDSFDALSRSYAYTFQRPLRCLGYAILAAIIGLLAGLLVHFFGQAVVRLAHWAVSWGSGANIQEHLFHSEGLSGAASFGATLMQFWNRAVGLLVNAFGFGYFFVASTAIYLLLRFHVDAVETDEVYLPDDDEQLYGMPPLATDAAGVPSAADAPPVASSPEG